MKLLFKPSLLLMLLWLMGCNQSTKTADKNDVSVNTTKSMEQADLPSYDPSKGTHIVGSEIPIAGFGLFLTADIYLI